MALSHDFMFILYTGLTPLTSHVVLLLGASTQHCLTERPMMAVIEQHQHSDTRYSTSALRIAHRNHHIRRSPPTHSPYSFFLRVSYTPLPPFANPLVSLFPYLSPPVTAVEPDRLLSLCSNPSIGDTGVLADS